MQKRKPIIIAYDISRNKLRYRVRKILKEWRLGGQKSVFECRLSQGEAEELFMQLGQVMDLGTDHLLMAWVEPRRKILGRGKGRKSNLRSNFLPFR